MLCHHDVAFNGPAIAGHHPLLKVPTIEACQALCKAKLQCKALVYNAYHACYLKSQPGLVQPDDIKHKTISCENEEEEMERTFEVEPGAAAPAALHKKGRQQRQLLKSRLLQTAERLHAMEQLDAASFRLPASHGSGMLQDAGIVAPNLAVKASTRMQVLSLVTVGVKASTSWASRRATLDELLRSVRTMYGPKLAVLVADEGTDAEALRVEAPHGATWLPLPADAGLSAGRNAIVRATRTPFVLICDDDVRFGALTKIETLLGALLSSPSVAVAAGCYYDPTQLPEGVFERRTCYAHSFHVRQGGREVAMEALFPESAPGSDESLMGCTRVDMAHNFLLGRVEVLKRHGWDERMKMGEHEAFFYSLYLNDVGVLTCPAVLAVHSVENRAEDYLKNSHRYALPQFHQYFCKNFPEVAMVHTQYLDLDCERREFCALNWVQGEFIQATPRVCSAMPWDATEDFSTMVRPFVVRTHQLLGGRSGSSVTSSGGQSSRGSSRSLLPRVPLLALVFTHPLHHARRAVVRKAWLRGPWYATHRNARLVPWQYAFVMALHNSAHASSGNATDDSPAEGGGATGRRVGSLQRRGRAYAMGDVVVIRGEERRLREGDYRSLVWKTVLAFEWALEHVDFGVLLKVDDDTVVHVSRLWQWLMRRGASSWPRLYGGDITVNASVVRLDGSTRGPSGQPFTPKQLQKWGVPHSMYSAAMYPPYAMGGGYLVGPVTAAAVSRLAWHKGGNRPQDLLPIEDAFVGMAAASAGITPIDVDGIIDDELSRGTIRQPLSTSILIHRRHRWVSATRWKMNMQIDVGPPKLSTGHGFEWREKHVTNGCDCANLASKLRLCYGKAVEHGCWFVCCQKWPTVNPAGQYCSHGRPRPLKPVRTSLPQPAPLPLPLASGMRQDEPTPPAHMVRYLILSAARSASTSLCWALAQHPQIQCNYELLNTGGSWTPFSGLWKMVEAHQHVHGPAAFESPIPNEETMCTGRLGDAVQTYWGEHCRATACGFKIFREHLACKQAEFIRPEPFSGFRQLDALMRSQRSQPRSCRIKVCASASALSASRYLIPSHSLNRPLLTLSGGGAAPARHGSRLSLAAPGSGCR